MRVEILAAESLGVRSMAVEVECSGVRILIDPGAALGPRRYGLPPDRLELERLSRARSLIRERLRGAELVVITHYHFDHYLPDWAEDLRGKRVFLKDPVRNINRNQAHRAAEFLERLIRSGVHWEVAEGRRIKLPGGEILFSGPFFHGPDPRFGCVISVVVRAGGQVFVHTSDVSGPVRPEVVHFLLEQQPDLLLVDGPSTYLGPRFGLRALEMARENLLRIIRDLGPGVLILDHHLLRDLSWRRWAGPLFEAAEARGTRLLSGAEFSGKPETLLEAERLKRFRDNS
ncbi:MBL fold metallo-hydrolase [Thermosulfurimonas sp.]|uniref:MBL fold metallo-hydrolase n=1 Tax=Thermosulfurimonas sp. TaxID=2080236 RepID=UPI0025D96225|nr:MBL fold metallo-hydrolase [Thermosulfurimonas sp.]